MVIVSRKDAPQILATKREAIIKAAGNSMRPIMETGDTLYLKKVHPWQLRKGDAIFCKVKGNVFVHKIVAIDSSGQRYLIANNKGHTNGWTNSNGVYGLCVQVNDRVLISDEEIEARFYGK